MAITIGKIELQQVPASLEVREQIRAKIETLDLTGMMTRNHLEKLARTVVNNEQFLAWSMVLIGSRTWRSQVLTIPFGRRLLLLPHCMRSVEYCPAKYDLSGLCCESCGACELGNLKTLAKSLGYHVMIAEGSPIVMQWILNGKVDAILGVGCLRSLERVFEKLQLTGIPAMAVPLHASNCRDSITDIDWVTEMIQTPFKPFHEKSSSVSKQPTWIHLLRGTAKLFEKPQEQLFQQSLQQSFQQSPPELLSKSEPELLPLDHPIRTAGRIGLNYLSYGGKYYRPFIVLAAYDALTGSLGTTPDGEKYVAQFPDWVTKTAAAMESFHKASLIHDDIEDEDLFRYGQPTLHQLYGTAAAINIGDYLLGWGYHQITEIRNRIPFQNAVLRDEIVIEMLHVLSSAHLRLCEGQGAELHWKSQQNLPEPSDILKIYVLKTAPAFEAALIIGVLLAVASGAIDIGFYRKVKTILERFSRHLGVAYQIKNDLDDWLPDRLNKQTFGADYIQNRPTLLRVLANFNFNQHNSIQDIFEQLQKNGVFEKARQLIRRYANKAREVIETIDHVPLQQLLFHFVETIAET
ncbi:MAG: polyprenyl synthetase family protein [Planctomycetaceae bacterium]|jgi:geranylgeranyl pyrophosphate synthase|nr:polyprenyl synthetase family protein [Planctomycetaceae bacterium]